MPVFLRSVVFLLFGFLVVSGSAADTPAAANSHPVYRQLRTLSVGPEAVSVKDFHFTRDAASFHLRSGTICFTPPVEGKVTGAVFIGDGNLVIEAPTESERASLRLLTKDSEFSEVFTEMVLRFTDGTYDEIKKAGTVSSAGCDAGPFRSVQNTLRNNRIIKYNVDGRILQDVLRPGPGGFFMAFLNGRRYNSKEVFVIDPNGAPPLIHNITPEEVALLTYDEAKLGTWAAFHLANEYKDGTATGKQNNSVLSIQNQNLDVTIEKNGQLTGKATTTFVVREDGTRAVPFSLFPSLRVQSVTTQAGDSLSFIQEDKDDDANFFVILPAALAAGEKFTITTSYTGKDAVSAEGNGNYFPVARENWYPNVVSGGLANYASYEMTIRVPKGLTTIATGTLVSEAEQGDRNVSVWKSEVPQSVAGFNIGRFKREETTLPKLGFLVQSYANKEPPSWVVALTAENSLPRNGEFQNTYAAPMGNMSTTPLLKKALAEGQVAVTLYSGYFGPLPNKRLALTQQTACNFGQAWPGLVWLPICSFFDTTVRHSLGLDWGDRGYWKSVTPHEVAHQWWGHQVGFSSYRDQWMSEGFSEMSASLFLQLTDKDPKKFLDFWNSEREILLEKSREGFRPIDAGPVTMGYRLDNTRTGDDSAHRVIYPKGAYILHMLRMMLWNSDSGDDQFKALMQDFVKSYSGRAATTEDFKAAVERHMTPEMNLDGNKRMDWFFNEYVYGTALPSYQFTHSFERAADGTIILNFKLTQANVDDRFRMLVPIYLELDNGKIMLLGRARVFGNKSLEQKFPIGGLKNLPRRALISYYYDVLSAPN